jgi:ABC-type polysaccharide/polyol phosphate export permease
LIWTLVRTDFKVRYHGTLGGFVWAMLKPLTMFVLLMSVFSFVFGAEPNYRLNLIIGLFLYDFFTESTKVGLVSLHTRGFLLTRARCPAWILVVSSLSNPLITLIVFSAALLASLVLGGHGVSIVGAAAYVAYMLAFTGIVTGFSLAASVLFLRYRDLNQVWEVISQAGLFLAPIIYPLGMLPERLHIWLYLWAPTPVIEFSRAALVEGVLPTARAHVALGVATALALTLGAAVFRRFSPRSAELV